MKPINYEAEKPGARYGRRVVLGPESMISGETKRRGVRVRCDCGREDVVNKYMLIRGRSKQCVDCKEDEKSRALIGRRRIGAQGGEMYG